MTAAIRLEELVKEYAGPPPVRALNGVDLEVREGEVFGEQPVSRVRAR